MQVTRKIGHVTFEHDDEFKGDVTMRRGEQSLKVSVEALRTLVAESVRVELAVKVQRMTPSDLLRRMV